MPKTKTPREYQFEIDGQKGAYYYRFRGSNSEIMFHSENIGSKQNCLEAIRAVQRTVFTAPIIDLTKKGAKK